MRFINQDPIKDGHNWHVYGNPLLFRDPNGLWVIPVIIGIVALVVFGIGLFMKPEKEKSSSKKKANKNKTKMGVPAIAAAVSQADGPIKACGYSSSKYNRRLFVSKSRSSGAEYL